MALAAPAAHRHSASQGRSAAAIRSEAMTLSSPAIAIHVAFAVSALVLGPLALTSRKGSRLHRSAGYAWVALMLGTALSSLFIRDFRLPNLAGYTPIHIVSLLTFAGIGVALYYVFRRNIAAHRKAMRITYVSMVFAGLFALSPNRALGQLVWHQLLAFA
jgi:uncharacterized membrane protein